MATILIIDDEESIRALLRTTLEAAGYEVVEEGFQRPHRACAVPPQAGGLGHHRNSHARAEWAGHAPRTDA